MVKIWPLIFITSIILVFFYPVVVFNKVPLPADLIVGAYYPWLDYNWGFQTGVPVKNPIVSDAISFIYPMRMLAINLWKNGEIPLWNPYLFSGSPLLANFQSAPFSPTNIFYIFFDSLTAWSAQVIVQHIFAAFFMFILLRSWFLGKWASILGGIIYAFSGFNLLWSQWNAHTLTASFIPLIIFVSERWIISGKWYFGAALSTLVAVQIISGYPQIVFYTTIAVILFFSIKAKLDWRTLFKFILFLAYIAAGFGLAAFQLLPAKELVDLSQRGVETIPLKWVFLDYREIITFVAPDFYGSHATQNYWGYKNYLSTIGFVGVTPMIFALLGLLNVTRNIKVIYAFLLVVISLLLAFPTKAGMLVWESNLFASQAGVSYKSLVLFSVGISILSAFGFDYWFRKDKLNKIFPSILIPLILIAFFATFCLLVLKNYNINFFGVMEKEKMIIGLRNLIIPFFALLVSIGALVLGMKYKKFKNVFYLFTFFALILEFFYYGWKYTPFSERKLVYPSTPIIDFLHTQEKPFRSNGYGVMPVNQNMPVLLESPGGYDAVYPLTTAKYISVINSGNISSMPQDRFGIVDIYKSNLLDISNTKYFLFKSPPKDSSVVFKDKSVSVVENTKALPRALFVYSWQKGTGDEILQKLTEKNFPINNEIILEKNIDYISKDIVANNSIKYIHYGEQKSTLDVETDEDGLFFVSETWYPGWKAFVDGIETEILRADYTYRAIQVPKGHHEIKFVYKPESFKNGVLISLLTIMLLSLVGLKGVIGKIRHRVYT